MPHPRPWSLLVAALALTACTAPDRDGGPASDIPSSAIAKAHDCSAKLPPKATIIYDDAEADVHQDTNMESLLRVKVMMLIVRDKIRRADARPAAERAAECLELLQQ